MGNNTPLGCYCPPPNPLLNGIFITPSRPPQGGAEEKRRALAGTFNRRSPPSRSPSGGRRRGRNSEKIPLRAILSSRTMPPRTRSRHARHGHIPRVRYIPVTLDFSRRKSPCLPPYCLRHASDMPPTAWIFLPRFREETAGTSPQPPRIAPRAPPRTKKAPRMRGSHRRIYERYNCIDWREYSFQNSSSSFISFIASSSSLLT